jgi:hypothetical protein
MGPHSLLGILSIAPMCRMPSFYAVAAGATMSGTGVVEAE